VEVLDFLDRCKSSKSDSPSLSLSPKGSFRFLDREEDALLLVSTLGFFASEPWICSKSFSSSNIDSNGVADGKGLVGSTLSASEAAGDMFAALGLAAEARCAWSFLVLTGDGDCDDGAEDGIDLRVTDAELREDEADAVSVSEEDACPTWTLFLYTDGTAATKLAATAAARSALAALI
jgi:hypothetical protein